ncbi:hypothetical protein IKS73_06645 [bacterium]|nr:hypothetical protein [bacterium]
MTALSCLNCRIEIVSSAAAFVEAVSCETTILGFRGVLTFLSVTLVLGRGGS